MEKITPIGKQKDVMAIPTNGHYIVLGTAGSGKTTMALLRAEYLSNIPNGGKVLVVTFNGALVEYMKGITNARKSRLQVESYHRFARGYLGSRGKMQWNVILNPDEKSYYIEQSVESLKKINHSVSTLKRPIDFFIDEITFIEKFGFSDSDDYYAAERIGRSSAFLSRENRKWIFAAYKKYIELREAAGRLYDWDDLALYTYNELHDDNGERRYSHIIVDEGQDFSPMMIKSLVNAVGDGGSFTFFGDVAQQIYGSRLSWRDSGINVENIIRLDVNYRNPATITAFSSDITKSKYWQKDADMVIATMQIAEGPKPILIHFGSEQHELRWIVERAISIGKTSSTVIVLRNRDAVKSFEKILNEKGCCATVINRETPGYPYIKTVYLTTFHAVKGLEFENVLVPFLSSDKFPTPETISSALSEDEAYANEIKLLYVAATRSKFGLYMTYSGTLTPLFPVESASYDAVEGDTL